MREAKAQVVERANIMKCPQCLVSFHDAWHSWDYLTGRICSDCEWTFQFRSAACPACKRLICILDRVDSLGNVMSSIVYPKGTARPVPVEGEKAFANDFREACLVIGDSENASAALSRRCLQNLLREKAKTEAKKLAPQIQEVLDSGKLPSHLADAVDSPAPRFLWTVI